MLLCLTGEKIEWEKERGGGKDEKSGGGDERIRQRGSRYQECLFVYCSILESVFINVSGNEKGKWGHNDECSEIISLITVMMSIEQTGSDDKNTRKQPEPPIDVWLTTL